MPFKKKGSLEYLVGEHDDYDRSNIYVSQLEYHEWLNPASKYLNLMEGSVSQEYNKIPKNVRHSLMDIYASKNSADRLFSTYKQHFIPKLLAADRDVLPTLVEKFSRVSELLSMFSVSEENANLYYEILNCLISKECTNPSALLHLWKTCSTYYGRTAVFQRLIGGGRKPNAEKILNYVLVMARRVKFNFWGIWDKEPTLQNLQMCPVTVALFNPDLEQMTLLMKFGFKRAYPRFKAYNDVTLPVFDETLLWLKGPLEISNSARSAVIAEVMMFLLRLSSFSCNQTRLAMIQCFKLLWNTIPDPYVTKLELQEELHRRFATSNQPDWGDMDHYPIYYHIQIIPDTEESLLSVCEFYDEIYLCEPVLSKPRSLRHLCRCNIRDQLRNNFNLPNGVDDLPLPPHLKSYLWLKNI